MRHYLKKILKLKKFFLIFLFFNNQIFSTDLDQFLNWNSVFQINHFGDANWCFGEDYENLMKLSSKNFSPEEREDLDLLISISKFVCAEKIENAIKLYPKLKTLISDDLSSENKLILFSLFAKSATWAYLESENYKSANDLYGEITQKILDLFNEGRYVHGTSVRLIKDLNRVFEIYGLDEDFYQSQELLEIFILGKMNFELQDKKVLAETLLDIRFQRLSVLRSGDAKSTERILTELNSIFTNYLYGHGKKEFEYTEFHNFAIEFATKENLLEKYNQLLKEGGLKELKVKISLKPQDLEILLNTFTYLFNLNLDVEQKYLKRLSNQYALRPEIENVFEAFNLFGVWLGEDVCDDLEKVISQISFENLNVKDFMNYESSITKCKNQKNKFSFESYLDNLNSKKSEIKREIKLMTELNTKERFEKSKSFSFGENYENLTDLFLYLQQQYFEAFSEGPNFEIYQMMIKNNMKILDFFPNKTLVREIETLATLNRFLKLTDFSYTRFFSDTHNKRLTKIKDDYKKLLNEKFNLDVSKLIETIESNENGYGFNIKDFGKTLSEYLKLQLQSIISDSHDLGIAGFYNLHLNKLYKFTQERIEVFKEENEPLLLATLNQSYKENNVKPKFGLEEPLIFNRKISDFRNLQVWGLYFIWLAEYFAEKNNESRPFPAFWLNNELENLFLSYAWSYSPTKLTYAFFINHLKEKYKELDTEDVILKYANSLRNLKRFKEAQINLKVPDINAKLLENSLVDKALKRSNEIYKQEFFDPEKFLLPVLKIEDYQSLLKEDEAISVLMTAPSGEGPIMQLFIDKSLAQVIPTGWSAKDYEFEINSILADINLRQKKGLKDTTKSVLEHMYFQFLSPIKEFKKIYLITDKTFSKIPFSLFIDENGNFAAERHSFVMLDSIISFNFLQKNANKLSPSMKFVGIGDPNLKGNSNENKFKNLFLSRGLADLNQINDLSSLPNTKKELEEIANIFSSSELFLADLASEANLNLPKNKKLLSEGKIISFATHTFSDKTNFSREQGLVLTPPKIASKDNDGLLTSYEISNLSFQDSIVILSACDTDKPIFQNAGIFSGLPRAFIEAGASTVLLTQWNIESNSARIFMTETLKNGIKNKLELSESISETMKKFINGSFGEEYKHPYYWSPYLVLGNS